MVAVSRPTFKVFPLYGTGGTFYCIYSGNYVYSWLVIRYSKFTKAYQILFL